MPHRDRLRAWACRTRTRKCRVRSLLANFGSAERELLRHLKYIARAWLIHAFLSSSPTSPGMESVSVGDVCERYLSLKKFPGASNSVGSMLCVRQVGSALRCASHLSKL